MFGIGNEQEMIDSSNWKKYFDYNLRLKVLYSKNFIFLEI